MKMMNTKGNPKIHTLLLLVTVFLFGTRQAMADNVYLSLYLGNITFNTSSNLTNTAYKWSGSSWVKLSTAEPLSSSDIYIIGMWDTGEDPTTTTFPAVTTINGGSVVIVGDPDDASAADAKEGTVKALDNWDTEGTRLGRRSTTNKIIVRSPMELHICLDNIWSVGSGWEPESTTFPNTAFVFYPDKNTAKLYVDLKGDNRLANVRVKNNDYSSSEIHLNSSETGTLTAGIYTTVDTQTGNHYRSAIGSLQTNSCYGLFIDGGTIYAGAAMADHCTAIGAGGNAHATVTITGGTVTAVTSSSGTAIGGGRGLTNKGGNGDVTISGGTVYAYNHGDYQKDGTDYIYFLGCAIGGGSCRAAGRGTATVNISGGTVYAQALGAPAIGGGCSVGINDNTNTVLLDPGYYHGAGAAAEVNISGGTVTAISKAGLIYRNDGTKPKFFRSHSAISGGAGMSGGALTFTMTGGSLTAVSEGGIAMGGGHAGSTNNEAARPGGNATISISGENTLIDARSVEVSYDGTTFPALMSIGGGYAVRNNANSPGGSLDFTMTGGTVMTGSLGGGINEKTNASNGTGTYNISGGTIHGQLILWDDVAASSLTMTGGSIEGKVDNGNTYTYLQANGGGVYLGNGTFDMSAGTITGCTATKGGGVYQNGGTFNMSGGSITGCTANSGNETTAGGAALFQQSGVFNMSGGIITDNHATGTAGNFNGGGVYKGGSMYVSGSPIVKGNTFNGEPNNVYIPLTSFTSEPYIYTRTIYDDLSCGASIGVTKIEADHTYTNSTYTVIAQDAGYTSTTNIAVPLYGAYMNRVRKSEIIIPASFLKDLEGQSLSSMTFHLSSQASSAWGGSVKVFLREVEDSSLTDHYLGYSASDVLFEGTLNGNAATMPVVFTRDYTYNGGNLLIGFWKEAKTGTNSAASFTGIFYPGASSSASDQTSPYNDIDNVTFEQRDFIPKITFTKADNGIWVFPDDCNKLTYGNSITNHYFFDDKQICGVYNSPIAPYSDPGSTKLYFVKHSAINNWLAYSASTSSDYEESGSTVTVKTAAGLSHFAKQVLLGNDYAGKTVVLSADINLAGHNWEPIGYNTDCDENTMTFAGVFDGKGHSIYNMTCTSNNVTVGLFGHVTGTVKNVLVNGTIGGVNATSIGGIAGELGNGGKIYNSNASVGLEGASSAALGGLVGDIASGGSLKNSYAKTEFTELECITVCEGSNTNSYIPVYGSYASYYNKTEFIIPASSLTGLSGKEMNSMVFYLRTSANDLWGAAEFQVFLKEVSNTTFSGFEGNSGATIVYEGSLDGTGTIMTVSFTNPYTYNGGNLLVGFYQTEKGTNKTASFYGISTSGTTAVYGRDSSSLANITTPSNNISFLPKVTFGVSSSSTGAGLVGTNAGTVQNCYVLGTTTMAGTGTVSNCYASTDGTDGTYTAVVKPYVYGLFDNVVRSTNVPLVKTLNNWVDSQGSGTDYAHWARPTTATINGDYPILKMTDAEAVAANSSNPDVLHYSTVNSLISGYNTATDAIYLYKSTANVSSNSSSSAKLFIDEDAAITQAGAITANVGVTLKNTQSSNTSWDWHMFSPALSNAPLGISYIVSGTDENVNNTAYQYAYMSDPPLYTFTGLGYFPTAADEYYREWDYYCYYEPQYHWINFKRNGISHWHEDGAHEHIDYMGDGENVNESIMKPGKGYLLATKRETVLQAEGSLNNADVSIAITTDGTYRTGYNLIGNPFQSYYDFNTFASDNASLWGGVGNASYILLSGDAYTVYAYNASNNTLTAPRWLHPHQGFMIVASNSGTATFYNSKRIVEGQSEFRSDPQPNYALINLIATGEDGNCDITTVELGRPDKGGAVKAYDLHLGKGSIYTHYEGEDYSIAFTQPGITEVGVRFEADEEAMFTMTWDMENGNFGYLHLIDNKTGTDTDCLSASEYRFSASPDDYKSRFKLVFEYTGVEENNDEDEVSTSAETFAFVMGDALVVNGEGVLQLFDLTGRKVMERTVYGTQTVTTLPVVASGVYVARLKGVNGTQTQKIIIRR